MNGFQESLMFDVAPVASPIISTDPGRQKKKCTKCGEEKPATTEYFHNNRGGKYGLRGMCTACHNERVREQIKEPANAESRKRYAAEYVKSGKAAKSSREWRKKNPESARASAVKWKGKNKDHIREAYQKWRDENRDKCSAKQQRADAKIKTDPYLVLRKRLKARLRAMLKGSATGTSEKLFGFTRDELVNHFKNQFTLGMTWEALMRGEIHIDHKRPVSSFNITSVDDPDFKVCWGLDNLQPLWAEDNYSKSAKRDD